MNITLTKSFICQLISLEKWVKNNHKKCIIFPDFSYPLILVLYVYSIWKPNNEFIKLIKIRNADVHFDTRKTINIRYHSQQPIRSNILVCLIPLRLFFYPPDLEVFFICPFWKKKSFGSSIFMEDLWQYSYMLKWEITCVVSLMSSHFFAIVIVMAERFSVSLTNT